MTFQPAHQSLSTTTSGAGRLVNSVIFGRFMRIHRLTAFHVPIGLKRSIRHASHHRSETQTLLFRCVLRDGTVGWGEGLPRTYVTGESIDSAWRMISQTDFGDLAAADFTSAAAAAEQIDLFRFCTTEADAGVVSRGCFGNSVRAAAETAILDAACRAENRPLSGLIRQLSKSGTCGDPIPVNYSGIITGESPRSLRKSAILMRLGGIRAIKVKVGMAGASDADILRRVRFWSGRNCDLRLDANEAWRGEEAAEKLRPLLAFGPTCIEQPVPHSDVAALRQLRDEISIPIMLDESLCCSEDAERAVSGGLCDLFNIRLSKCGGILRSLRLVEFANISQLNWQLGCQVGETGILSAAGRHFASVVRGHRFVEGSYDRFLVRERLTEQDLTFGYAGYGQPLDRPGLGVEVDECRVRSLARRFTDVIAG